MNKKIKKLENKYKKEFSDRPLYIFKPAKIAFIKIIKNAVSINFR